MVAVSEPYWLFRFLSRLDTVSIDGSVLSAISFAQARFKEDPQSSPEDAAEAFRARFATMPATSPAVTHLLAADCIAV